MERVRPSGGDFVFARMKIHLGFSVFICLEDEFVPIEVEQDGFRFLIYSPYKSQIAPGERGRVPSSGGD